MVQDNLTRDEARLRSALISDLEYEVRLDLTTTQRSFDCEVVIRFGANEAGASTFLDAAASEVTDASLNGRIIPSGAFDGSRLQLDGLEERNELRISAVYEYSRTGVGLHRFVDPVDGLVYLHSDFEPFDAHRMYPCFDQPDLKGRFAFSARVPERWLALSNTTPYERPPEGEAGVWRFETTPRISTYITALVAGGYHEVHDRHRGMDLGLYCRRSLAEYLDPQEIFEITKQGFDFFNEAFAYPFFLNKYDQAFVAEFNPGAMENLGLVTFNERYVFRSKVTDGVREGRANTILHEMAHMWFGDLVTMRWWDDLWLNESFATFMATLASARATRFSNAWVRFAQGTKAAARRQDQLSTTHPIAADIPDIHASQVNFDAITYSKGASVLRQLVAWVGEEEFLKAMSGYFRRYEFGNADLSEFLAALEEVSGRDLSSWSKEWLQTAGVNTLRPRITLDGDEVESVAIMQEAPGDHPTLRSHRLRVGLYDRTSKGIVRRSQMELDVRGIETLVPLESPVSRPALLLINDDDLAYAKVRLDEVSMSTVAGRLREIDDPLTRALCWAAAWDMVRDAELPSGDYLRLFVNNIDGEDEISSLQSLIANVVFSASRYSAPAKREPALELLAGESLVRMLQAAPGGDFQLAWAQALVAAARTQEHLAFLLGMLDGSEAVEGLSVDPDLRWAIIARLVTQGAAGASLAEEERRRDPSDAGRRRAGAIRAAAPSPGAKADAWRSIADDPTLPLAAIREMGAGFSYLGQPSLVSGGFHHPDQAELIAPYAERYFEKLLAFWESRTIDESLVFARTMYPFPMAGDDLIAMTDRSMQNPSLPFPLRRILLEAKDEIERTLRAEARDTS